MGIARFVKAMAMVALFNGTLYLVVREEAIAGEKEDDAKKYAEQLRKGKDAASKVKALQELGTLGQIKKSLITPALPDIYKAVEDKDAGVRAAAAETLGKADEPYEKVGDILVKLIKEDKDEAVKIGALKGLTAMRDSAKDALPAIREVAKNADKKSKLGTAATNAVKAMAAVFLFNGVLFLCVREDAIAGEKEDDAKKFTEQLRKGKDASSKVKALQELGALGQIKKSLITPALPDIYKAVEDKDAGVRAAAAETLGKADEPYEKVGDILVKLIKEDKEESVKIGAIKGLTAMRDSAKDALPAIREVAKNADKKSKLGLAATNAVKAISGAKK